MLAQLRNTRIVARLVGQLVKASELFGHREVVALDILGEFLLHRLAVAGHFKIDRGNRIVDHQHLVPWIVRRQAETVDQHIAKRAGIPHRRAEQQRGRNAPADTGIGKIAADGFDQPL